MGNGKRSINNSLLDTVALEMFGDEETGLPESDVRVERLLLDLVRPDPVQPRRVLPEGLYSAFHSNRLTPSQALRELVQSAQVTAQQHGRPFSSVLELLDFDREDGAEQPLLTPDEMFLCEPDKTQSEPIPQYKTAIFLQQLTFPQSANLVRLSNKH